VEDIVIKISTEASQIPDVIKINDKVFVVEK